MGTKIKRLGVTSAEFSSVYQSYHSGKLYQAIVLLDILSDCNTNFSAIRGIVFIAELFNSFQSRTELAFKYWVKDQISRGRWNKDKNRKKAKMINKWDHF